MILCWSLFPCAALAQETEMRQPPTTQAERALAMIEQITNDFARLEALRAEPLPDATAEARAIRDRRIGDEELRIGRWVRDLANLVLEAEGDPAMDSVRATVMDWLQALPAGVSRTVERRTAELQEARKARELATADEQNAAELRLTAARKSLNEALGYYAEWVPVIEAFGLDASAARAEAIRRLGERADQLSSFLKVTRQDRVQLARLLATTPDDSAAKLRALELDQRIDVTVNSLRTVADYLRDLGVDTSDYQKLLVQVTGNVSDAGLDTTVISALISDWYETAVEWGFEEGPRLFANLLVLVAIIMLAMLLARLVRRLITKAFEFSESDSSVLLQRTVARLAGQIVMILGVLVGLSQIGVSVGPMLAGLGIAGFVVAFALQDTLSNFASGAFILFYRPFDVGDIVEAGGVSGKVLNMTLVTTTILTADNQTLIVPNKSIWGSVIRNVSAQGTRRVDLVFGIGYSDDIEHAERVLEDILARDDRVLAEPAPVVRLHELGDSAMNFLVRPWVKREDYWDVYWDLTRTVKLRFDAEGISMPYPQQEVHIHNAQPVAEVARPRSTPQTIGLQRRTDQRVPDSTGDLPDAEA
jgi:small conductance mechanosensitive channel